MTSFQDGPADGVRLILKRAPMFLRVVRAADGKWDALDQLNDTPHPAETIYAYRKIADGGSGFTVMVVDYTDKRGRRCGTSFVGGTYQFVEPQPEEAVLRNRQRTEWPAWCVAEAAKVEEQ